MDYDSLIAPKTTAGSIKRWMNYDALDAETIVEEAMGWINERLRIMAMRKTWSGTISSGADTLAFPTDFLEERWLGHTTPGRGRIRGAIPADVERMRTYDETSGTLESGEPSHYSYGGDPGTAIFNMRADRAYTVRLVYLARLALDGTTTTNWITTNQPRILRAACVGMANEWMKKEGERDYWLAKAESEILLVNQRHEMQLKALDHVVGGGFNG